MKRSDYTFLAPFVKTIEGRKFMGILEELCEVNVSAIPGETENSVCSQLLAVQAGRRSVYNKILAAVKLGEHVHES